MVNCISNENSTLIDDLNANVAGTFAVICSLLGFVANAITMYVILSDKKVKNHCTTPG